MGTTLGTFDKENGMNLKDIWQRKSDKFKNMCGRTYGSYGNNIRNMGNIIVKM
jgi:hypothetical protein